MTRYDAYPPELQDLVSRAFSRLRGRLEVAVPTLSAHTKGWMHALAPDALPETYFTHPQAFPMLLLPWWLEATVRGVPARAFHGDVVYSTLNGYYFVRMIDDLMDAEHPPGAHVLPSLIVFHTEFQLTYHRHFPHDHPFWQDFTSASFSAAETASLDAGLETIDRGHFLQTSARKIAGAKVPIAAVCHRYGRPELLGPWSELVDLLGRWHQMLNDMRGWHRDLGRGTDTYFLSEASRRTVQTASIAEWVIAEGFDWGFAQLDGWMEQLLAAAGEIDCPPLTAYLEYRHRALADDRRSLMPSVRALRLLATIMH
jgi:hypothetical protein